MTVGKKTQRNIIFTLTPVGFFFFSHLRAVVCLLHIMKQVTHPKSLESNPELCLDSIYTWVGGGGGGGSVISRVRGRKVRSLKF